MKSKLLIIFSICVSTLYAEDNTYIKQQIAYKDPGASGKELPNGMYILQHHMSDGSTRSEKIANNK
jgi:hypothetical protein